MKFEINEYSELLALHRVIVEAKFSLPINDVSIIASSLVTRMANRVIDAIIELETEQDDEAAQAKWNKWKSLDPSRQEWEVGLQHIWNQQEYWDKLNEDQKPEYVSLILSPYSLSSKMLDEFIEQADEGEI